MNNDPSLTLTPSVLRRIFTFILLIICHFFTASKTYVRIEIVQILFVNLLTSIDPLQCRLNPLMTLQTRGKNVSQY